MSIWDTFIEHWKAILSWSVGIFLAWPILKWVVIALLFFIFKSDWLAERFVEVTFVDNIIPWYLMALTNFRRFLGFCIIIILVITIIFHLLENSNQE